MLSFRQTVELAWPVALGAFVGALSLWKGPHLFEVAVSYKWNVPSIYSAVFNLSAVYTAFLFSLYTYILTSDSKFIAAAEKSTFFKRALALSVRAMFLGALVSVASIPMMLIEPVAVELNNVMWWIAGWISVSVWSLGAFAQAASILVLFAKRDSPT